MTIADRSRHLKRHAEIARLLFKYGRGELVRHAGLENALDMPAEEARTTPAGENPALPEQLAHDLEALGPTFVKLGQLLSTRADLLPIAYLDALVRLQDEVEPVPFADIEATIETDLGIRISKAFSSFDETPLASASLGQVHRATLRDGRAVVVKVQRPGVREQVADDMEALAPIAAFLDAHSRIGRRYDLTGMLRELRETLHRELDYRLEARNLQLVGGNLAAFERIVVPQPVMDYTSSRVLTMDEVDGRKITDVSPLRRLEIDGSGLAEDLFRAYLQMILVDGLYHADPHPGNIFLTTDNRVALLDLGMVARLSRRMEDQILKLILAVADGQGDEAADIAISLGEELPSFDRQACHRRIASLVAWNQGIKIEEIRVGRVVLEVTRLCGESGLRPPAELTMLAKTLLNLDEVGRTLDPSFDPNASIRRNAGDLASGRMRDAVSMGQLLGAVLEGRDFLRALPGRANKIMDAIANNQLKLTVEAIDEDRLISGIQKIANRITVGLILAALIVGAALVMRVDTPYRILGYPGLAIILFVLAAGGGAWMAIHTLLSDSKDKRDPL